MGAAAPNTQRARPSAHARDIPQRSSFPRPTYQCCPFLCRRWSSSRSLGPGWQTGSWGKTRVECAGALGRGHQVRQCSGKVGAAAPVWQTLSAAVSRLALEPGEFREQGGGGRGRPLTFSRSAPSHPVLPGGPACYPALAPTEDEAQGPGPGRPPHPCGAPHAPTPRFLTGIPCSWGLSSRLCSSFLEASIFSWSAASTMYLGKVGRGIVLTKLWPGHLSRAAGPGQGLQERSLH